MSDSPATPTTEGAGRLTIDPDRCQGHLRCWALAPHLFDEDEFGHAVVTVDPLADDSQVELAEQVARACPERAITVARQPEDRRWAPLRDACPGHA